MQLSPSAFGAGPQRSQFAANLGGRACGRTGRHDVVDRQQRLLTFSSELLLLDRQLVSLGAELAQVIGHALQLESQVVCVGLETGDNTAVHQLATITLH